MSTFGTTLLKAVSTFMKSIANISAFMIAFCNARIAEAHTMFKTNPTMANRMSILLTQWSETVRKLVIQRINDKKTSVSQAWRSLDFIGIINLARTQDSKPVLNFNSDEFEAKFFHFTLNPTQLSIPLEADAMCDNPIEAIQPMHTLPTTDTVTSDKDTKKPSFTCFQCGGIGHTQRYCPKRTKPKPKPKPRNRRNQRQSRYNSRNDNRYNSRNDYDYDSRNDYRPQYRNDYHRDDTYRHSRSNRYERQQRRRSRSRTRSPSPTPPKNPRNNKSEKLCPHFKNGRCNNGARAKDCSAGVHKCENCGKYCSHYSNKCRNVKRD